MREEKELCGYVGVLALADPVSMHRSAVSLLRGTRPVQRELFLAMKIPRAFIVGERSLPDPQVEGLAQAGVEILVVPEAGHGMMDDNPPGFAAALAKALA